MRCAPYQYNACFVQAQGPTPHPTTQAQQDAHGRRAEMMEHPPSEHRQTPILSGSGHAHNRGGNHILDTERMIRAADAIDALLREGDFRPAKELPRSYFLHWKKAAVDGIFFLG